MLIALLTDFGYKDSFVGTVKGVIKSINPSVDIIDITHGISSFNILEGALALKASYKYFPKYTIFTVVVDPGVGSERKAVVVKTKNYIFIAPDNGVLSLALQEENIEKIVEIENQEFLLKSDNNTFHGRDIFAPVAAYISRGVDISLFGRQINKINEINLPKVIKKNGEIIGQILMFDKFGNAITNLENLPQKMKRAWVRDIPIKKVANNFQEGDRQFPSLIKGSFGLYEIFLKEDSAKDKLNLNVGDPIRIQI